MGSFGGIVGWFYEFGLGNSCVVDIDLMGVVKIVE